MIKKIFSRFSFPLLLCLIGGFLAYKNFTLNTWLFGWDTLNPEFNLSLNFQRVLNGVWREEQGLGALTGHAQISELPRLVFLWLSSLVLPINYLRYFFFFLCLILGPLGVYFFLQKNNSKKIFAFLGGLFYLLNLGTLQHFLVPFEMFAILYAFLPWLILFAGRFLDLGSKKYLLWFTFLTIISSPLAYASVLWFAYLAFLSFFILMNIISSKGKAFKRGIVLILLTIVLNAYWLLPNLYFMTTSAKEVGQAKINLMFSERAFLTDEKYANFTDVSLLKGFLFDWQKYENGKFNFLLRTWKEYLALPGVTAVGYFIFTFVLLGLLGTLFKKNKVGILLLPGFFFSFIFLIHGVPVIETFFTFLRNHLDIFKESLRFPWTKFSIFVMFGYSVFFGLGTEEFSKMLKHKKIISVSFSILMGALLIILMLPAFKGNFVSEEMRIKIPQEYFDMYRWFDTQPVDKRVALLPATNFWGWEYYRFGFEGAGFVWFGLKQPILVRDFDRWQPGNENFYWEMSYAIYSKNERLLENVFQKYQVSYIMLDDNMISPSWPMALNTSEIDQTLSLIPMFKLEKTFGKIKIYSVSLQTKTKDFVSIQNDLTKVNGYQWGSEDRAFSEFGNYVVTNNSDQTIYYPFRTLFTGRSTKDLDFSIEDKGDHFLLKKKLPETVLNYDLDSPKYIYPELGYFDSNSATVSGLFIPSVEIRDGLLEVNIPKTSALSTNIQPFYVPSVLTAENCNKFSSGTVETLTNDSDKTITLKAKDATNCSASFYLSDLLHKYGYLISIDSENVSGRPLLFWLENLTDRKADLELYLDSSNKTSWLIQPPMEGDGLGYLLHLDNISTGSENTINRLGKISINPIPYEYLMGIELVDRKSMGNNGEAIQNSDLTVNHPNPSLYEVAVNNMTGGNETLVLSQAYHEGWKAYEITNCELRIANLFPFLCGKELEHVKVNNWENGWNLNSKFYTLNSKSIIILVFWPQYLEYFGFVILVGALGGLVLYNYHK